MCVTVSVLSWQAVHAWTDHSRYISLQVQSIVELSGWAVQFADVSVSRRVMTVKLGTTYSTPRARNTVFGGIPQGCVLANTLLHCATIEHLQTGNPEAAVGLLNVEIAEAQHYEPTLIPEFTLLDGSSYSDNQDHVTPFQENGVIIEDEHSFIPGKKLGQLPL